MTSPRFTVTLGVAVPTPHDTAVGELLPVALATSFPVTVGFAALMPGGGVWRSEAACEVDAVAAPARRKPTASPGANSRWSRERVIRDLLPHRFPDTLCVGDWSNAPIPT